MVVGAFVVTSEQFTVFLFHSWPFGHLSIKKRNERVSYDKARDKMF